MFVGLGSGALPAFVHHHLPSLPMTVVEIDPLVRPAQLLPLSALTGVLQTMKIRSLGTSHLKPRLHNKLLQAASATFKLLR